MNHNLLYKHIQHGLKLKLIKVRVPRLAPVPPPVLLTLKKNAWHILSVKNKMLPLKHIFAFPPCKIENAKNSFCVHFAHNAFEKSSFFSLCLTLYSFFFLARNKLWTKVVRLGSRVPDPLGDGSDPAIKPDPLLTERIDNWIPEKCHNGRKITH